MFGNLKNKLGEVADLKKYSTPQNIANSLMGSRQLSGTQTPSIPTSPRPTIAHNSQVSTSTSKLHSNPYSNCHINTSDLSDTAVSGIATPVPSISHSPLSPASSRTHSRQTSITSPPLSPGLSPTHSVEEGENGVATPTPGSLPPTPKQQDALTREVQKLRAALEQQQDAHLARLAAKDAEWREKFARHADKVSQAQEALQKSEIVIASQRNELDTANELNKELSQRLRDVQDDCDELEGLSVQEAAKIKHMLLNTSTELEAVRGQLKDKVEQHAALQEQLHRLHQDRDVQLHQLQQQVHHLQQEVQQLEHFRQQQQKLRRSSSGSEDSIEGRLKEMAHQHSERERALHSKMDEYQSRCARLEAVISDEQRARAAEQRAHAEHEHHCAARLSELQHRLAEERERGARALHEEREKSEREQDEEWEHREQLQREKRERELGEAKERHEEQLRLYQAEWEQKEQELAKELTELKAEKDEVRWKHVSYRQQDQQIIKELQQQLGSAVSRASEACQAAEAARAVQQAAESRCQDLQNLLYELQERTQGQVAAEKNNSERLTVALTAERAEKGTIETARADLEARLQVVSSEKSTLSARLDEYVEKVQALEQQTADAVLHSAQLRETVEQLQQQLRDYHDKLAQYESGALAAQQLERSSRLAELQEQVTRLQDELEEKKQALKVQSQRMADMKKTVQRELRISPGQAEQRTASTRRAATAVSNSCDATQASTTITSTACLNSTAALLPLSVTASTARLYEVPAITRDGPVDPINLEYLKHVVIKFVTSREYEAIHLTKAVSTLLHLSSDEERLLHDTLSWRMSWFGHKPSLGSGQKALHIPPP